MKLKSIIAAAVLLFAPLAIAAGEARAANDRSYILATASTGGTYYPVGVALATLVKVKLQSNKGVSLAAINSAGSAENLRLLREKEAHFAILQGLYAAHARAGSGPLAAEGPQNTLRSITMLWQNVEHFVLRESMAKTGTFADFVAAKGAVVALGKKNSGTLGSNAHILKNFGLDIAQDYRLFHGGYGPSADSVQNARAVGMNTSAGVPVGAVTKLFAAMPGKVRLLSFTPEQAKTADGGLRLWSPFEIKAKTYPGQDEAVTTIAQPNILAVHADVPDEDVYLITKAIFENLSFLKAIHKATAAMSLEAATRGLPLALHPGALRYFQERNIDIPPSLITD